MLAPIAKYSRTARNRLDQTDGRGIMARSSVIFACWRPRQLIVAPGVLKGSHMSQYRQKLLALLRDLFQFDSADLDFGIYAVMNHKRDQVERFIQHDLLDAIAQGLQLQSETQQGRARASLRPVVRSCRRNMALRRSTPTGNLTDAIITMHGQTAKRLRDAYLNARQALDAASSSAEMEAQVYNDLYRFFARYYDDGDFIAQRRYGAGNKYAIPYNGEEVFLYWANFDQYYVKTVETFTDYRFTVEPALGFAAATVHFKLRQATVEQNNVKGEKRFFVLAEADPVQWDAASRTLTIGFVYRPLTADEQLPRRQPQPAGEAHRGGRRRGEQGHPGCAAQGTGRQAARRAGQGKIAVGAAPGALHRPQHARLLHPQRPGRLPAPRAGFLLKNEVLNLEDLDWAQPALVQATAARLKTLRAIAGKIIDFLAQIEEFQKRLWEKRKFVVQSDYCVTLDRVPAALYAAILANDGQRAVWQTLYGVALGPDADLRWRAAPLPDGGHRLLRCRFQGALAGQLRRPGRSVRRTAGARENYQALGC